MRVLAAAATLLAIVLAADAGFDFYNAPTSGWLGYGSGAIACFGLVACGFTIGLYWGIRIHGGNRP
jgi:hypothetical protein